MGTFGADEEAAAATGVIPGGGAVVSASELSDTPTSEALPRSTAPSETPASSTSVKDTATPRNEAGSARLEHARHIVRQNAIWAFGAGAVPIPILDVLAIAAVQLRMVKQLCVVYRVEFSEHDAKNLIASLMASLGSVAVGAGVMGSLLKSLPLVGQTMGGAAVAITAGASVHAIGNVFVQHFNAKGTLQSLDTARMGGYFREEFEKAKRNVRDAW